MPLTIVLALGLMTSISWQLTLATLAVGPLVVLFLSWAERVMRRLTIARQDRLARLNVYIAERLGAVQLVQAFGREQSELADMRGLDREYFAQARRLVRL